MRDVQCVSRVRGWAESVQRDENRGKQGGGGGGGVKERSEPITDCIIGNAFLRGNAKLFTCKNKLMVVNGAKLDICCCSEQQRGFV